MIHIHCETVVSKKKLKKVAHLFDWGKYKNRRKKWGGGGLTGDKFSFLSFSHLSFHSYSQIMQISLFASYPGGWGMGGVCLQATKGVGVGGVCLQATQGVGDGRVLFASYPGGWWVGGGTTHPFWLKCIANK